MSMITPGGGLFGPEGYQMMTQPEQFASTDSQGLLGAIQENLAGMFMNPDYWRTPPIMPEDEDEDAEEKLKQYLAAYEFTRQPQKMMMPSGSGLMRMNQMQPYQPVNLGRIPK